MNAISLIQDYWNKIESSRFTDAVKFQLFYNTLPWYERLSVYCEVNEEIVYP